MALWCRRDMAVPWYRARLSSSSRATSTSSSLQVCLNAAISPRQMLAYAADFELLRDTYSLIMNSPVLQRSMQGGSISTPHSPIAPDFFSSTGVKGFRRRQVAIHSHAEFLTMHGGPDIIKATRTRDGENVMLDMYKNAKFMF